MVFLTGAFRISKNSVILYRPVPTPEGKFRGKFRGLSGCLVEPADMPAKFAHFSAEWICRFPIQGRFEMPTILNSAMDFVMAFDLGLALAVGFGFLGLVIALWMPMTGSDQSDSYGGWNYALAMIMIGVIGVIAVPMIWADQQGLFYSFCFCGLTAAMATFRWHMKGQLQQVLVLSKSDSGSKKEVSSDGRKKS
jgi:hypothetical protein